MGKILGITIVGIIILAIFPVLIGILIGLGMVAFIWYTIYQIIKSMSS